jgi:hypothetical protein
MGSRILLLVKKEENNVHMSKYTHPYAHIQVDAAAQGSLAQLTLGQPGTRATYKYIHKYIHTYICTPTGGRSSTRLTSAADSRATGHPGYTENPQAKRIRTGSSGHAHREHRHTLDHVSRLRHGQHTRGRFDQRTQSGFFHGRRFESPRENGTWVDVP